MAPFSAANGADAADDVIVAAVAVGQQAPPSCSPADSRHGAEHRLGAGPDGRDGDPELAPVDRFDRDYNRTSGRQAEESPARFPVTADGWDS